MTEQGFGAIDAAGLAALGAFAARLGEPTGRWVDGRTAEDGVLTLPWFDHGPLLSDFLDAASAHGLVVSFDWPGWLREDGGAALVGAPPEAMAGFTLEQVQRVATVLIRQDRFCEGALAEAFADGRMPALIRRLAVLASAGA